MPARIVVVLNDPVLADATVSALKASGYDALAVHDSMVALSMLEQARDVELLVTSTDFSSGKPNGMALALMTKLKRPELKVIFADDPESATLLEDIGHLMAEPILLPLVVETVRTTLTA
jgi:DNA-binding NtrC family response regulator